MKEKNTNYGLIVFIVIVVILFIPIISDYIKSQNIQVLSASDVQEKINSDENLLVYVGSLDKSTKKDLKELRDLTKTDYSYEYSVVSVESSDEIKDIIGEKNMVALVVEGDIQKTYKKFDEKTLEADVNKYFLANITNENKSYKVAKNFNEYKKLVKSNEVTVAVFGRDTCYYCNKFKPVYNAVAEKYGVDIYYFDSDNYDSEEYTKIINMDLTVPSKCSTEGKEFKLSDGFGTPLTLFTKKGKVVDCISGYVNRSNLIEKLKSNDVISE